ncbi:uncharacterized protein LOC143833033 isoform X2 [Paroedura picta]|uniref:uncharacterized protein LOC143833033 isoform X2 n=1 Tax=Paroedura picta TaxID=143630 RepID=UPI0040576C00
MTDIWSPEGRRRPQDPEYDLKASFLKLCGCGPSSAWVENILGTSYILLSILRWNKRGKLQLGEKLKGSSFHGGPRPFSSGPG